MVCGCSFWGWEPACLPGCFSTKAGWWYRIWGQQPAFSFRTDIAMERHCGSRAGLRDQCGAFFPLLFLHLPLLLPDSVRARQDCSSALSKRKHIADNTSEVREHSKLFWLIAIFVSPLSIYKYSKRNCITSLKMNVRKN